MEKEWLMKKHIERIQADIDGRDDDSIWDQELNKIDRKNICSLHEARVPLYSDHGPALPEIEMNEFSDLKDGKCPHCKCLPCICR